MPGLQGRKRNGSEKGNHALIYVSADSNRIEAASFIPDAPAIMRIGYQRATFLCFEFCIFFLSLSRLSFFDFSQRIYASVFSLDTRSRGNWGRMDRVVEGNWDGRSVIFAEI